jgi:hypothetical protein
MRVFINSRGIDAPDGATVLDAIRAWDPREADALAAGERRVTDSRGLPTAIDAPAYSGAIFRILPSRRSGSDDADETTA